MITYAVNTSVDGGSVIPPSGWPLSDISGVLGEADRAVHAPERGAFSLGVFSFLPQRAPQPASPAPLVADTDIGVWGLKHAQCVCRSRVCALLRANSRRGVGMDI